MSGPSLGDAVIEITADLSGFNKSLADGLKGAQAPVAKSGNDLGKKLGDGVVQGTGDEVRKQSAKVEKRGKDLGESLATGAEDGVRKQAPKVPVPLEKATEKSLEKIASQSAKSFGNVASRAGRALEPIRVGASRISDAVGTAFGKVQSVSSGIFSKISTTAGRAFGSITSAAAKIRTPIARVMDSSLGRTVTGAFTRIKTAAASAFSALPSLARRALPALGKATSTAMGKVGGAFSRLGGFASSAFGKVTSVASSALGRIGPALSNLEKEGRKVLDAFPKFAQKSMDRVSKIFKTTLKVGVGSAIAGIGVTVTKGFSRLSGIENATAKLSGLGNSAKNVASIMDNALAAVKGTAYGMDEAATTAATAVAAGVKPGQQLEKYLRLTADAASLAQVSMGDMGAIMNKVTTNGRAMTDDLNQVADKGIPIWIALAKHFHMTTEELRSGVAGGLVTAKDFQEAMQDMVGGSALAAGDTTAGAFKNMGAAISRVGANLLQTVFPMFKDILGGVTDMLDGIGPAAEKMGKKIGSVFSTVVDTVKLFIGAFTGKGADVELPFMNKIIDAGAKTREVFDKLKGPVTGTVKQLKKTVGQLFDSFVPKGDVGGTIDRLTDAVAGLLKITTNVLKLIGNNPGLFKAMAAGVLATALAFEALNKAVSVMSSAAKLAEGLSFAIKTLKGETELATIATRVFGFAMDSIPVFAIIAGIIALGTALVIAYKKSEKFRKIVDTAFAGVKKAAKTVADFFTRNIPEAFDKVRRGAQRFADFFTKTIPNAFQTVLDWVKANWPKLVALITGPIGAATLAVVGIVTGHGDMVKKQFTEMADGAEKILGKLGDLVGGVWQKVADKVPILETARSKVVDVFSGMSSTAKDAAAKVGDAFSGVSSTVKDGAAKVGESVRSVIDWFGSLGDMSVGDIVAEIGRQLGKLPTFAKDVVARTHEAMSHLADRMIDRGGSLIGGLIAGAKTKAAELLDWVRGLPLQIHDAMAGVAETLKERGAQLVQGIIDGAKAKVADLLDWVKNLPGRIKETVGDWAAYLATHGGELIQGLIDGAKRKLVELQQWFQDLPTKIGDWLSNAGEWLKKNGPQIIDGLIKGLKIAIPALLAFFIGIPLLIVAALVGSAALLVYAGATLVWELAKGVGKAIGEKLQPKFTALTDWISSKFSAAWQTVTRVIVKPVTDAAASVGNGLQKVRQKFTDAKNWVTSKFSRAWSKVSDVLASAVRKGGTNIGTILGKVKDKFTDAKSWVTGHWKKAWSNTSGAMAEAVGKGRDKIGTIWQSARDKFSNAKTWVGGKWKSGWSNVSGWISNAVGKGRDKVGDLMGSGEGGLRTKFTNAKNWVRDKWSVGWAKAESWMTHPIKNAKKTIADLLGKDGVRKALNAFVAAAGTIMNKLKKAFGQPINWVIDNVIGPLLTAIGKVAGVVNIDVPKASSLPHITGYNQGGVVPGYTPGRDPYIIGVSGGEPIMRPEFGRAVGEDWVNRANAAARLGGVAGAKRFLAEQAYGQYANGGVFAANTYSRYRKIPPNADQYDPRFDPYLGGFALGGIARPINAAISNGLHDQYTGFPAVDASAAVGHQVVAGAAGRVTKSYDIRGNEPRNAVQNGYRSYGRVIEMAHKGFKTLYAHLSQRMARVGDVLKAGQQLGVSGNTGHSTGPHLHFGAAGKSPTSFWGPSFGKVINALTGAVSSAAGLFEDLPNPAKIINSAMNKAVKGFEGQGFKGTWADIAIALPKKLASAAVTWGKEKIADLGSAAGDAFDFAKGAAVKGGTQAVIHAMMLKKWSNSEWPALKTLVNNESGWNPKAVNSSSGAYGLFQALPANKIDKYGSRSSIKAQGNFGLNYIADRYGTPTNALRQWMARSPHWYDNGGWLPPGVSTVMNGTGKREPAAVFTAEQWKTLHDIAQGRDRSPHQSDSPINIHLHGIIDSASAAREIKKMLVKEGRTVGGVDLPSRSRKLVRAT